MEMITIRKNTSSITFAVDASILINMLSIQSDYLSEQCKGIHVYYNIVYNRLYVAVPIEMEKQMNWRSNEKISINDWISTFSDYGQDSCYKSYMKWLIDNFGAYALVYGRKDILEDVDKAAHIVIDARFYCTASICVAIYNRNLPVAGLQQRIANDLQKVLQDSKHIRLNNGKLMAVV